MPINLFEMGRDGKVPYQRLRGRKLHPDLIEFGECIHYLPLNHLELGKAEARWKDGTMLHDYMLLLIFADIGIPKKP